MVITITLKEAYEKLHQEAISLRRENAKLKEGTYIDADRASNEKEIRHLQIKYRVCRSF
jgi:cell division protein FtsB